MFLFPNIDKEIYPLQGNRGTVFNSSRDFILGTFGGLEETTLDSIICQKYSLLLKSTPELTETSFPNTYQYVQNENNKNTELMAKELENIEIYLSEGQTVYHGGVFLSRNPKIGDNVLIDKIFSVTIDPVTATQHAHQKCDKEGSCCFWSIELKEKTRVFPAHIDGQDESEIIILDELKLKIIDIQELTRNSVSGTDTLICIFLEQV